MHGHTKMSQYEIFDPFVFMRSLEYWEIDDQT